MNHSFSVGGGKASKSIQNDTWVCDLHRRFFRPLVIIQYTAIALMSVGLLGGTLALLKEVIEWSGRNFLLTMATCVGPGFTLFIGARIYVALFGPRKKHEYITTTQGSAGTVWRDKGWM